MLPFVDRAIWFLIASVVIVDPVFISRAGYDAFRVPKELLFRAQCTVLLALIIIQMIVVAPRLNWKPAARDRVVWIVAAAAGWSGICAYVSGHGAVVLPALLALACQAVFFVATYFYSEAKSLRILDLALIPAAVNALLSISQALNIWSPVVSTERTRLEITALLGNANDIGMFLVPAAVICCGLISVSRGRRRMIYVLTLIILVTGLIASQTLTALIALSGAIAVFVLVRSRRSRLVVPAIAIAGIASTLLYPPVAHRLSDAARWIEHGDYDRVLSGRLTAFLAALQMARDHPITGVGPGGFAFHYFEYASALQARYPQLLRDSMTRGINFGEAHNDHLQMLAEYGTIGYAIFVAAIVLFWHRIVHSPGEDPREQLVRAIGIPFIVSLLLLMAAQFPLNLLSPSIVYIFCSATLLRWGHVGT